MSEQTNAKSLSAWSDPSHELVTKALARIGDWQHRRVFFERLENPRWVEALEKRGSFTAPTKTTADPAEDDWWPRWPEGEYLVRMAPMVPNAVTRIMMRASAAENPFVHELVLQAALQLPPADGAQLAPAIRNYVIEGSLRDGQKIVELIGKLSDAGLRKAAVSIAEAAFSPRAAQQADELPLMPRRVVVGVDAFWYEELLPQAISALDRIETIDALSLVCKWLKVFQEVSGDFDPTLGSDTSVVWRPAIADDPQNARFGEIGDSLVETVRDKAIDAVARGRPVGEVLAILEGSGQPLLRRIGMHVLSVAGKASNETRTAGYERLTDTDLLRPAYRHEYSELARHFLPLLTDEQSKAWESLILGGPAITYKSPEERDGDSQYPDETLNDEAHRRSDLWQLHVLSAIGEETLPSLAKSRLAKLVVQHGKVEHADFPAYTSSIATPVSPVTPDELRSMTVDEVRDYLSSSTLQSFGPHGMSKSALADVVRLVVSERAAEFSAVAETFAELEPTYARAFVAGLADGISAGGSVDWAHILGCVRFISHRLDDDAESLRRMDQDIVLKGAQLSAAMLVQAGASSGTEYGIPVELLAVAIEAIAPLVQHPDPTPSYEERYGGSNMDPRMLSLNTIRPVAIRTMVQLALTARTVASESTPARAQMHDVIGLALQSLLSRITPDRDRSAAVASAFGEALASLGWIAPEWTQDHAEVLLTADDLGEVVLSTALQLDPSPVLLSFVTPAAEALLDRAVAGHAAASSSRNARRPVELIGDYAVAMRVQNAISPDHPLLTHFFEVASVADRSSVLGRLGWSIMHADDVPEEVLQRAKALWDSRADAVRLGKSSDGELSEFYWWVRAGKFDSSWWLPRLEQAVGSQAFDPRGMLGASLEAAANQEPGRVTAILERLLSTREKPLARYDLVKHAPGIIAAALDSGDSDATLTARKVMDLLGKSGQIRIAELVEQRRRRG